MASTWWTNPSQLDAEQQKIVALHDDGHHLVVGPPGSGKTNLLLLRASYLHKKGIKNIAIITFARTLREFLASGAEHYAFSPDKIQTYMKWAASLLGENGVQLSDSGDFSDKRQEVLSELKKLSQTAPGENKFDCILLDEAQDYTSEEIEIIKCFSTRLFAVGDAKQRIQSEDADTLKALNTEDVAISTLSYHYRNGLKVCRVADGIHDLVDCENGLEVRANYDEESFPSTVVHHSGIGIHEQIEVAIRTIETQLLAYPDEYIGVLCPKNTELDRIAAEFLNSDIGRYVLVQKQNEYKPHTIDQRVILTTVHGAKGLEYRAVHFLAADSVKKFQVQKKMSYTAITRCKTSLTVYSDGDLPGYFEKGIQSCSPPPREPTLDELF